MSVFIEFFALFLALGLLTIGFTVGRWLEARHYASIRQREKAGADVLVFTMRFPPNREQPQDCRLVSGAVVISSDYFKQFVAGLRKLFGGRFRSYETLLDRARREAVLRMKDEARRAGYGLIVNVKFETTNIAGGGNQPGMPAFEVMAYGTALRPAKPRFPDRLV